MSKLTINSVHSSSGVFSGDTASTPTIDIGDYALYAKVDDELYYTDPTGIEKLIHTQNTPVVATKSYGLVNTSSGTYYYGGFYDAPASSVTLTQASLTVTHGTANSADGAHVFLVASGPGIVDAGVVSIVCSGTSITNAGVRTAVDSEVIIPDITASVTNDYYQTAKKWLGIVTYTLTSAGATNFSYIFNYGHAKWEDFGDNDFLIDQFEVVGEANANDLSGLFDIILCHHVTTGWTYSAAAFMPGNGPIVSLKTDYTPDNNLTNGHGFAYDRTNIGMTILGSSGEGTLIKVTTGSNNVINHGTVNLSVIIS